MIGSLLIFQLCTSTYSVHAGILKLWRGRLPCPLIVFSFHYVSRLSSSFVRSQLTLPVPAMGIRLPPSQNGVPIHRVRTHSLSRVQHINSPCSFISGRHICQLPGALSEWLKLPNVFRVLCLCISGRAVWGGFRFGMEVSLMCWWYGVHWEKYLLLTRIRESKNFCSNNTQCSSVHTVDSVATVVF
jgi:hypothetical protein